METRLTIYVVARDSNGAGPQFYNPPIGWVENPILAEFYCIRDFCLDLLNQERSRETPGFEHAFVEQVEVTCRI